MSNLRRKAFTLIELLVVIAIIAILAAILFPVFAQAKASAKKATAISNFKQQGLSYQMYEADHDDMVPIFTYNLTYDENPTSPDSSPQLEVYPYVKNEPIYDDPMDLASDHDRIYTELEDPDGLSYAAQQKLFNYLYKSDFGLNWDALCPLYTQRVGKGSALAPVSIKSTEIANPAKLIFGIDSVWNRTAAGAPYGGGNAGVDEPCFFDQDGTFNLYDWGSQWSGYYWYEGWLPSQPLAWNVFGGVWPWHTDGTIVVVGFADGHAKAMPVGQTSVGCNVKNHSAGTVTNQSLYMWSWRG